MKQHFAPPQVSILIEQHFAQQFFDLMKQHFAWQFFDLMKQHFAQ
jgi:hypothetical protein